MPSKVTVYRFGPGLDDTMRTLTVEETNVVIDRKRKEGIALVDNPTDYIMGKRISPYDRKRSVYSSFAGDGEGLVVSPNATDYRNVEEYEEQLDEDTIVKKLRVEAVEFLSNLTATAKKNVLMRAREERRNPQQNQVTILTTLMAVVISVVLLLYVMTFVGHNGGLSETLFPTDDPVDDNGRPAEVVPGNNPAG